MKNRRTFLKESSFATASIMFCGISSSLAKTSSHNSPLINNSSIIILHGMNPLLLSAPEYIHYISKLENNGKLVVSIDHLNCNEKYTILKKGSLTIGIIHANHLSTNSSDLLNKMYWFSTKLKKEKSCNLVIGNLSFNQCSSINLDSKLTAQSTDIDLFVCNMEKNSYEVHLDKFSKEVYISYNNIHSDNFKQIEISYNQFFQKNNIALKNIELS